VPQTTGQEKSIRHGHVDDQMMQVFSHSVFNSEYDDEDVTKDTKHTKKPQSYFFGIPFQVTIRFPVLAVLVRDVVE